ncbi:hypothetical protein OAL49_08530 [Gammaproteobacteria bacterium]|nr:hypothetical protein [Gammaproteobacteria bacterium]MEE3278476.1 hypothetical protein [Pseudomonadota bacterium]|tara:strand:+ start:143 stop:739 length:597 start_codon:yes stop_codon:yes gene_type:complete
MKKTLLGIFSVLVAQSGISDAHSPPHSSAEWQISAYSTAAPDFIGKRATIMSPSNAVLRQGDNGWTCMAGNPRPMPASGWDNAHHAMPVCADAQSMKWMQAYGGGTSPELDHDGFMWMLHGDVGEDNTTPMVMNKKDAKDPSQWIESGPHLMLMPKDPNTIANHTTDFRSGAPYVMFPGSKYAHLMIPLANYYQYQQQ